MASRVYHGCSGFNIGRGVATSFENSSAGELSWTVKKGKRVSEEESLIFFLEAALVCTTIARQKPLEAHERSCLMEGRTR